MLYTRLILIHYIAGFVDKIAALKALTAFANAMTTPRAILVSPVQPTSK